MPLKTIKWWAAAGVIDNHNYVGSWVVELGAPLGQPAHWVQCCHLCGEIEPPLRQPTGDERTDRAAMHLVHGVTAHLDATAEEWNA